MTANHDDEQEDEEVIEEIIEIEESFDCGHEDDGNGQVNDVHHHHDSSDPNC